MVDRAVTGAQPTPQLIEQERGYETTLLTAVEDVVSDWATSCTMTTTGRAGDYAR